MHLIWAKKLKNIKILKNIYRKYNYTIINIVKLNLFKIFKIIQTNKLNFNLINIIKFKNYFNLLKKIYKKKYKKIFKKIIKYKTFYKKKFKLKNKFKYNKNFKNIFNSLKNKKTKINELLYFLKYFLIFRKRQSRIFNLSKVKSRLSKRKFFLKKFKFKKFIKYFSKKYKSLNFKQKKHINLINLDLYFNRNKRFYRLHRLYDIRKKYIKYLSNNRSIYKTYKFRNKFNYKFIKRHIKSISSLNIKSRVHMYEFSLRNVILKLKYAYTYRNAELFIKSGFLFLNGHQEFNPFKFIYKGDIIELIYSKFIIKMKYMIRKKLNTSMRKFKKYNWRTIKNKINYEDRRVRISRFSEKILNYKNKITKIFQFDYRVLSYIIVNDINFKKDLTYLNKKILPIYLLKLFNWKLIS